MSETRIFTVDVKVRFAAEVEAADRPAPSSGPRRTTRGGS